MSTASTTHPVTPEEIMALLDGELSPERAQAVSVHTECCSSCQQTFASLLHSASSLSSWTVGPVPHLRLDTRTNSAKSGSLFGSLTRPGTMRVLGWAAAVAAGVVLLAISVPNMLRSRMAANEASSVGSLRAINAAAETYNEKYGHYPRSLKELGPSPSGQASEDGAGLIDGVLAQGEKSGYRFSYEPAPGSGYRVDAEPQQAGSSGMRHFSTGQNGVLNANNVPLGVAADSNGMLLGGRGHAQSSVSVDGKPRSDQQFRISAGPMIARTVSLGMLVKDFDASRKALDAILVRYNGYAANLTVSTPQGAGRSLEASLRIPAPQLPAALAELKALGHVENENQNGEEVTQQHADLVARLKNSRETEQRLQAILTQRTGKISDVLEVEQEIARVRGEIEQMEAEQKSLEHRVDFATIDLKLSEEYKAKLESTAPSFSTQFDNALVSGYRNVANTLVALILFFAEYGPILLFWTALLGTPSWLVWRRRRQAAAPAL